MARVKLRRVPMSTYSVSLRSLALERSLNLRMDFAAISQPMAAHCCSTININIRSRSSIPIYFPALGRESSTSSSGRDQLFINWRIIIAETEVTQNTAIKNRREVGLIIFSREKVNGWYEKTTPPITSKCATWSNIKSRPEGYFSSRFSFNRSIRKWVMRITIIPTQYSKLNCNKMIRARACTPKCL